MDRALPSDKDVGFDLESGGNTSEEDASNGVYSISSETQSKTVFRLAWNGILNLDGSDKGQTRITESCSGNSATAKSGDVNLGLSVDKGLEDVQDVNGDYAKHEKIKPTNSNKPSKPPLPPKGPLLDAGDQKFVKELAELALRKRARIKKMKAVRKMKATKSPSSSLSSSFTSLSAMVVTVVFLLVIVLHGIKSASSAAVGLMASPEAAVAVDEGLKVQYPKNFIINGGGAPGSHYQIRQDR